MKLTKSQIRQLIKEELQHILQEDEVVDAMHSVGLGDAGAGGKYGGGGGASRDGQNVIIGLLRQILAKP